MKLVLLFFGSVYFALGIWLAVRFVNRRERWAKRILTSVVAVPVIYVASIGPACWISSRLRTGKRFVSAAYRPLLRLLENSPQQSHAFRCLHEYSEIGAAEGWSWYYGSAIRTDRNSLLLESQNRWHWEQVFVNGNAPALVL